MKCKLCLFLKKIMTNIVFWAVAGIVFYVALSVIYLLPEIVLFYIVMTLASLGLLSLICMIVIHIRTVWRESSDECDE